MKRGVAPGGFMLLAAAGLFVSLARVEARSFGRATQPREAFIADPEVIPYCNLPAGARARIPPLKPPHDLHGLKLLQVQVVARHGSRVPHTVYDPTCWTGYGFKWDCNMTELIDPGPSATPVGPNGTWVPWLYRKVYDGSPTVLGGTCHLGQLVKDGFYQEYANGQMLYDAYIGSGNFKLFDTDRLDEIPLEEIYLRADDDPSQRTEMSGMLLIKGLFQGSKKKHIVTVPFHTGDFALDDIYPNYRRCPMLSQVEAAAYASQEYAERNSSNAVTSLNKQMANALPGYNWKNMLDCLMTTACTGRPFPKSFDQATFKEAAEHAAWHSSFPFAWNNSHFSRLAMGPFAHTLLTNLQQRAQGTSPLKFAMFLGHDTTLLPLLCAWGVWDGQWPAYASIVTLELYEASWSPSGEQHYFRLVYSGKELVLPGCQSSLCPLSKLMEASSWASQDYASGCMPGASQEGAANDHSGPQQVAEGVGIAAGAIAVVLVLAMVVGMLLGTVATIGWSRRFAASEGETTQLGAFRSLPLQDMDA